MKDIYKIPISAKGIIFEQDSIWLRKNKRNEWELPGGKVDVGEQPAQAVVREMQEELGFETEVVKIIHALIYKIGQSSDESSGVLVLLYLCRLLTKTGKFESEGEDGPAKFKKFSISQMKKLNMPQFYKDAVKVAWSESMPVRQNINIFLKNMKKQTIVTVSGGFDPIHIGHVRMFKEAKKLGSKLVVILNNDNWLKKKKGFMFMPQNERKEVLESLKWVDRVILTNHKPNPKDMSVKTELLKLKPDIFANGGDRKSENTPEVAVCDSIGCKTVFNIGQGGKIQSSSWLIEKSLKKVKTQK